LSIIRTVKAVSVPVFCSLRNEEITHLKWSDIKWSDKMNGYLMEVENRKVVRLKESMSKKTKPARKKIIPIGVDLMEVLLDLRFEELGGTDKYVLEPFRKVKAKTLSDSMSKGFSHYYRQAYPDIELMQFKSLRKTYLSYLRKVAGDKTHTLSSHSDEDILDRNYIDPEIALKVSKMRVFG
jgi:hypothetical protein